MGIQLNREVQNNAYSVHVDAKKPEQDVHAEINVRDK
jgi:hypothetical protein